MFRTFLSTILALSLTLSTGCAVNPKPVLFPKPKDSVSSIQFGGRTFCTVFSINETEGNWASAAHCAIYATMVIGRTGELPTIDGKPAFVAYIDQMVDVAVFQSEATAPPVRFAPIPPKAGDYIEIIGFPYGITKVITKGSVGARNIPIFHPTFQAPMRSDILDITVAGGNSGSPVLNDRGEVVGILWGSFIDSPHALSVPLESVKRALTGFIEN